MIAALIANSAWRAGVELCHHSLALVCSSKPSKVRSRTSTYQLMVMDRDGSNLVRVFPAENGQGMSPHTFYWIPWYAVDEFPFYLAIIYQGDLWLVDGDTGEAQQLTGDGLITAIDWN